MLLNYYYLISGLIAFFSVYFTFNLYMKFVSKIGITGIDQQKKNKPELPTSAGIPLLAGLFFGAFTFLILTNFFPVQDSNILLLQNLKLFGAILGISLITIIGFFDDIFVENKIDLKRSQTKEKRIGLRQKTKALMTLVGALPLIIISLNVSSISFPFFLIETGLVYPLLLVPLAVLTVSNATNMLAGINGLEGGMMLVASSFLLFFAYINNEFEAFLLLLLFVLVLIIYLRFNWFPAKILPGDSLTYFIGGVFVTVVLIGNLEKIGILLFIPWIIESFLKLKGKFKVRSFGDLQRDGTIKAPYNEIYSLTHIAMKFPLWFGSKRFNEKQLTMSLILFEILIGLVSSFLVFSKLI